MSLIKLKSVSKFYYSKNTIASGFNKINLELDMGEFVVITGESGSGKSTLLNVISGLDSYEEGEMYINGEETSHYTELDYELYRRKYIGNIFQSFNLINSYTVYQNIELALLFNGYKTKDVKKKILDIIKTVGLTKYKNTKVSKLSGGQKQRVAIARALAKDTPIIVADEPTGNLDVESAKSIIKLLHKISKDKLIIIVTHNYEQVSEYATRKISMHDGKIIEDKKLKNNENVEVHEMNFKNITFFNKIRIGLRNTFNIKVKFALLLFVYFFLTLIVFSEYSSFRKIDYDQNDTGYNYYFTNNSPNRIILNKKDKTSFTKEELKNIKKIDNIETLAEDDLFLDANFTINDGDFYIGGPALSIDNIEKVDLGRMSENDDEIVIEVYRYNYYISSLGDKIIGLEVTLRNDSNNITKEGKVKIVGVKYLDDDNLFTTEKIYLPNKIIEEMRKGSNIFYSDIELKLNDHIFNNSSYNVYFEIKPISKVNKGEVYIMEELNQYCPYYNCINQKLNIKIKNLYYEDNVDLKVKHYINKDNINYYLSIKNYEEYANTIFINTEDYNNLFSKNTYQISVFLKDTKVSANTIKTLDDMGYKTIYMRDVLVNELGDFMGVIKIIRGVAFLIATIVLFFISYFIIKIILKSRNIYFSTIRILGATKKQARELLNIELLFDVNFAYIIFLALVLLVKAGIVSSSYISDMVTYFNLIDYIIVYIILTVMSLLISNRYAHKLFEYSVMNTYREEA